ncbi:hypothetical protein C8024_13770 [Sphingopyxis sp. BSNA05]|uniref:hypothetical protein n=1 Tax=Sphingopyxis sp. BSNA05 TaxID=1236614 RepID=UPI0015640305|nr:hypothetical protein [Sphingopyxis sp. BSNA05]NRD90302.1 hypothetical protein [Sphingopyxis sp. BSNA05]
MNFYWDISRYSVHQIDFHPFRVGERHSQTAAGCVELADSGRAMVPDCVLQVSFTVDKETEAGKTTFSGTGLITPCIAAAGSHDKIVVAFLDGEETEIFRKLLRFIKIGNGEGNVVK